MLTSLCQCFPPFMVSTPPFAWTGVFKTFVQSIVNICEFSSHFSEFVFVFLVAAQFSLQKLKTTGRFLQGCNFSTFDSFKVGNTDKNFLLLLPVNQNYKLRRLWIAERYVHNLMWNLIQKVPWMQLKMHYLSPLLIITGVRAPAKACNAAIAHEFP